MQDVCVSVYEANWRHLLASMTTSCCRCRWYNADDATVDCVNGTFSVSDPVRCSRAEFMLYRDVVCVCVCVWRASFVRCYCFGVRCYAQSSVGCASDVDGDGFDFDMDDGETSDTLSNKVGYVICVRRNFCITFTFSTFHGVGVWLCHR